MLGVVTLALLKPILTEKFGQNISGFIKALTNGITKDRMEKVDIFTKSVKTLATGILILTATIGLMAAGIALFGSMVIIESIALMTLFIGSTLLMLKWTSQKSRDIKKGTDALHDVAKAISILTLNVILLTITAQMMNKIEWESIWKVELLFVTLGAVMVAAMYVSDKWQKGGKKL